MGWIGDQYTKEEQEVLVQKAKNKEDKATETILFWLRPLVLGIVKKLKQKMTDPFSLEDRLHDGYIVILQSILQYDPNRNVAFASYVYNQLNWKLPSAIMESGLIRINHTMYRKLRKEKKELVIVESKYVGSKWEYGNEMIHYDPMDDHEDLTLVEARDFIEKEILTLKKRTSDIICLYYGINGRQADSKEISQQFNITKNSVPKLVRRCLRKIKETKYDN